ncbi:succinate--CoA ligase subunit alpha [Salirhabdus salicampi]|uniref:succinate--CoA ligase subunit alpha n=1 Tax=Salirhabdus salicampi TaxID=476102 RepID=UPI0020C4EAE3|nr:succinate--CoA ligase subunit alpha [Salirhabdus salicampi]MCP8615658.1 succinate--CoA ligase subunit alpha [Salirhabdus salicampi]
MSILIDEKTNVLIQGLTGTIAQRHALNMKKNNTNILAGVAPKKGGTQVNGWPIFDTVSQALDHIQVDLSLIYAPPMIAANAIMESIETGIETIVCVTEGIPQHDMYRVYKRLTESNSILLGPCSPGVTSPGKSKVGFLPDQICLPGNVGVVGKSGTLTYEICYQMKLEGIGQSSIVGIGGDPIKGLSFKDVIQLFEEDDETDVIVMVGEIGGVEEEEAAEYIKKYVSKSVVAFIAGKNAPKDVPMGHAGALISGGEGGYEEKVNNLKHNGIHVAKSIFEVTNLVKSFYVVDQK